MTGDEIRAYKADLHAFLHDYAKRRDIHLLDAIDAAGDVIDEQYFNIPKPDRAEILQLLTDYAEANGEPIENIYDLLTDVIEQEIDDYIITED